MLILSKLNLNLVKVETTLKSTIYTQIGKIVYAKKGIKSI